MTIQEFLLDPDIKRGYKIYSRSLKNETWLESCMRGFYLFEIKSDTEPYDIKVSKIKNNKYKLEETIKITNKQFINILKKLLKEKVYAEGNLL